MAMRDSTPEGQRGYFDRINDAYEAQMKTLSPMHKMKRCAVQGDVSDCNLFLMANGEIGVFDFNNCGDYAYLEGKGEKAPDWKKRYSRAANNS